MDWKDTRHGKTTLFRDLHIGDVFLCSENIIHIKITADQAFDVCNSEVADFSRDDTVEKRSATLVLE